MTDSFGPYRLEAPLGRGGMGEVHRAFDTRRERSVALKRLKSDLADDPDYRRRFRRESSLAARLSSPHVVPIHDFGEVDGHLFIDMRLIEGHDLRGVLTEAGPLPAARAVEMIRQVADALDCAHEDGLIHRDVKPSNVLITTNRGRDFAYLTDFGIVRAQASSESSLTRTGTTIGTLAYMAPELFTGATIDHRVDVYALGCMLYELITAQPPFIGDGAALMYQHLNEQPPTLPAPHDQQSPRLADVIQRALAKRPEDRFATAGDLADAALEALTPTDATKPVTSVADSVVPSDSGPQQTLVDGTSSAGTQARPSPTPTEIARPLRNRAVILALAGIVGAIVLIGGVWAWHTQDQPNPAATIPFSNGEPSGESQPSATKPAPPRTADQVVQTLSSKIATAKPSVVFDEQSDPNHLLGRPNGYLSKASFEDSRIKRSQVVGYGPGAVQAGGSVEVFRDAESANARKGYIQAIAKGFPGAAEYDYVSGPILIRVSSFLTPSQAKEYEAALGQ